MAEYIERDKKRFARLRKEAQQFQDDIVCSVGTDFMQTIAEAENRMIFDILKGLQEEPAADVVEVVRCKECKYQEDCARQMVHTTRDYVLEQNISTYNKVEYCSYGAKMDGKGEGE